MASPACCPANIRESKIAVGKVPQPDLVTPNAATDLVSFTKTNTTLSTVNPVTETDANDIGKGDEFASTVFPSHIEVTSPLEKYISSEFMPWCFAFALGNCTKTPTVPAGGFTYTVVPGDPIQTCIQMPVFTEVEQIRPGADAVTDRALVGMAINDFTIALASGPGRANARVTVNMIGTGKVISPSALTVPPPIAEHFLNAASASITIAGIDYVLNQSFISLEFRYTNNIRTDSGYFPGSGTQNGYAIRGRMEYGNREIGLTFVVRACKGSPEYNALLNQTEGPVDIQLAGAAIAAPAKHDMRIHLPRTVFTAANEGEADGIVTMNCTVTALKPTDGVTPILTFTGTTTLDGIYGLITTTEAKAA